MKPSCVSLWAINYPKLRKVKAEKAMITVTLQEAQAHLPELLEKLQPGGEMTITDHGQPLAQVKKVDRKSWPCKAGSYRKAEFRMAPDFDAPLEEFKEYMD
jgi:antitoxin (DNA-binding transcriptional repressor) of toxin-antitoxin stability system